MADVENMFRSFDTAIGSLSKTGVTPSNMPSASSAPTGNASEGMSAGAMSMVGAGIGAAADIGANLYGAYATNKENEKARAEAKQLAEVSRRDKLKQQKQENILRQKTVEQEEKQFALDKWVSSQDLRQRTYTQKLKSYFENRAKLVGGFKKMKESASKNADIRNILLQSFGRK